MTTPIALVGIGKIARDQHIPAIADGPDFHLAATASRSGGVGGVENHPDLPGLLAARPDIRAVSLTMPPGPRFAAASAAIDAGRHVMLEKPPGATLSEVATLARRASAAGVTLFATWHARHASGVAPARDWLTGRTVAGLRIDWKEDVTKWHPGQDWIWEPGGLGVFDPGINALSILTHILPVPLHLTAATLTIPENRQTPIAAEMRFTDGAVLEGTASFDWRPRDGELWRIAVETDGGTLTLDEGGERLAIDGAVRGTDGPGEYPALYARFAELISAGASDVDTAPLRHAADAFMIGHRETTDPFDG